MIVYVQNNQFQVDEKEDGDLVPVNRQWGSYHFTTNNTIVVIDDNVKGRRFEGTVAALKDGTPALVGDIVAVRAYLSLFVGGNQTTA